MGGAGQVPASRFWMSSRAFIDLTGCTMNEGRPERMALDEVAARHAVRQEVRSAPLMRSCAAAVAMSRRPARPRRRAGAAGRVRLGGGWLRGTRCGRLAQASSKQEVQRRAQAEEEAQRE